MSDETAARILHIERQERERALRAAFLRGARAAKAQILNALAMATWIRITPAIFHAIRALPDPEDTEEGQ